MIKLPNEKDQVIVAKAYDAGQEHVFRFWKELDDAGKKKLLSQVASIDFQLLRSLSEEFVLGKEKSRVLKNFTPPKTVGSPSSTDEKLKYDEAVEAGKEAVSQGRVAALMVAGGQASRLGYDGPKGTYPIGPVTGNSLFQILAEKVLAVRRRLKASLPLYVMTSEDNRTEVEEFFKQNKYFGLSKTTVTFFQQDMIPAVDKRGKLVMTDKDTILRSPNGHGGVIPALRDSGVLDDMEKRGISEVFYFQVDNPLVKIADPAFIGFHRKAASEMSLKSIPKKYPEEKVGLIGMLDGKLSIVEYSDLSSEVALKSDEDGNLLYNHANPAIHVFSTEFLRKLASNSDFSLPYHKAEKAVPCLDREGSLVEPDGPNVVKFETFIFDALKFARKTLVMEADREEEFSPVKNAEGKDSPDESKQAMTNLFGRWLSNAGVAVPFDEDGNVEGKIEISPLYALSAEEVKDKVDGETVSFTGSLVLQ